MHNFQQIFYLLLAFIFINGCKKSKENNRIENISISIVKDIQISLKNEVKLESNDESLIAYINDLVVTNSNQFVILDNRVQKVLLFDSSGKYVRSIGNYGEGPEEYLYPSALFIDNNHDILIADNFPRLNIKKYNSSGDFIKNFDLKESSHFQDFCIDNKGVFWTITAYDDYLVHKIDSLGNLLHKIEEPENNYEIFHKLLHIGVGINFNWTSQKLFVWNRFNRSINKVNNNELIPIIFLEEWSDPPVIYQNHWSTEGPSIVGNKEFKDWKYKHKELQSFTVYKKYLIFLEYETILIEEDFITEAILKIFDMEQSVIIKEYKPKDFSFIKYYKENKFYVSAQPEMDDDGNLMNPKILEYEISFPSSR